MAISTIGQNGLQQSRILTAVQQPAGAVLQVVSVSAVLSTSTTSTSYVTTGITGSITPTSASNKVLVTIAGGQCDYNAAQAIFTIYRNSTDLNQTNGFGFSCFYNATAGEMQSPLSGQILDSPATTSSTTYTIYFKRGAGSGTVYIGTNGNVVTITMMEIAA